MSAAADAREHPAHASEIADGMRIDWDVEIPMDDGIALRADVFRPIDEAPAPVLLSYGPYAKGLAFQEGYPSAWELMVSDHPDAAIGSTNAYQNWEVVDPERWVPDGYACVRVDSRGCGRSPGRIAHFSPRETDDLCACIEWAAAQSWSTGRVGLNGISYYAINQWHAASRQPPHLAAICVWEGAADWYRDMTHHGGILSTFWESWYEMQVLGVQHGLGRRGPVDPNTGLLACGPATLSDGELAANRADLGAEIRAHPLDDGYHRARSADWSRITAPLLSSANWGGQGLHSRGNFEGFVRAASPDKWLEVHGGEHWAQFYTRYGVDLQKRFFDRFLKGVDSGWSQQPRVQLQVRHVDGSFVHRAARAWPLPGTRWSRLYLDAQHMRLSWSPVAPEAAVTLDALGDGVTFSTEPLARELELTGPLAATLYASSSTTDADVFAVVRVFDPEGDEVVFKGAVDPHTPVAQGWLRASQRKLDPELTTEERPYHSHDEHRPLTPGEVYQLEVEIWPTSIVIPPGYRIALSIRGNDYRYANGGARLRHFKHELTGCGPFLHDDPHDRPRAVFGGRTTLHAGAEHPARLLLPVIEAP